MTHDTDDLLATVFSTSINLPPTNLHEKETTSVDTHLNTHNTGTNMSNDQHNENYNILEHNSFDQQEAIERKSTISSVTTGLSSVTSVSIHSSVSQKSAQVFHEYSPNQCTDHYSVVKETYVRPESSSESQRTCSTTKSHNYSSLESSGSAATTVQKDYVITTSQAESVPSTPIAPQKSSIHDALIEQFKSLHNKPKSVASSVEQSCNSLAKSWCGYDTDDTDEVVMPIKVTQYAFDSDVIVESKALNNGTDKMEHNLMYTELTYEPLCGNNLIIQNSMEEINSKTEDSSYCKLERTGSEDSLCSENVYYNDHEKHGQSSETTYFHDLAHQQIEGHINTSTDIQTASHGVCDMEQKSHASDKIHEGCCDPKIVETTKISTNHITSSDLFSPKITEEKSTTHKFHVPNHGYGIENSESNSDTLSDSQQNALDHISIEEVYERNEKRDLIPNVAGPKVRDSFRPVQLKCKEDVVIKPAIHIENTRITTPTVPINTNTQSSEVPHLPFRCNYNKKQPVQLNDKCNKPERPQSYYNCAYYEIKPYQMPLETIINSPHENKQHINEPYQTPGVNNLRLFFEHKGMNSVNSCEKNTHKSNLIQHDKSISSANYTKKNNVQHDSALQNVSHVKSQQHLNQPQHYDTCHKSNILQKTSEYEQQAHPHVEHQYSVEEEQQLPVSQLLRRFGGDARVRKLDHFDEKKTHKRTTSVRSIDEITSERISLVPNQVPEIKTRSSSVFSVSSQLRTRTTSATSTCLSHVTTMTKICEECEVTPPRTPVKVTPTLISPSSQSYDRFNSVRVVKSVRAFVNIWGQKDFVPPTSPLISVPRLPFTNRKSTDQVCPEPTSRKSYVTHTSLETRPNCSEEQNIKRKSVILCPSLITESVPPKCESVVSVASTVVLDINGYDEHHHDPSNCKKEYYSGNIAEHRARSNSDESFVLMPVAVRRAEYEKKLTGITREYSIKTNGRNVPAMVNVLEV